MVREGASPATGRQEAAAAAVLILGGSGAYFSLSVERGADLAWAWLAGVILALLVYDILARLPQRRVASSPVLSRTARLILYVYGLSLSAWFLWRLVGLWQSWTMPRTPGLVFILLITLLLAYGLSRGGRAIRRLSLLVLGLLLLLVVVDSLLLIPAMAPARLTWPTDWPALLRPALDSWVLLLLPLPLALAMSNQGPKRSVTGSLPAGLAVTGAYLLLAAFRTVLLLGELLTWDEYPLLRSLSLLELGGGLPRLEYPGLLALMGAALVGLMLATEETRRAGRVWGGSAYFTWVLTLVPMAALSWALAAGRVDGQDWQLFLEILLIPALLSARICSISPTSASG